MECHLRLHLGIPREVTMILWLMLGGVMVMRGLTVLVMLMRGRVVIIVGMGQAWMGEKRKWMLSTRPMVYNHMRGSKQEEHDYPTPHEASHEVKPMRVPACVSSGEYGRDHPLIMCDVIFIADIRNKYYISSCEEESI